MNWIIIIKTNEGIHFLGRILDHIHYIYYDNIIISEISCVYSNKIKNDDGLIHQTVILVNI